MDLTYEQFEKIAEDNGYELENLRDGSLLFVSKHSKVHLHDPTANVVQPILTQEVYVDPERMIQELVRYVERRGQAMGKGYYFFADSFDTKSLKLETEFTPALAKSQERLEKILQDFKFEE